MLPPILLIIAVLGSILSGYATPTRGAALGALGAILLAAYKLAEDKPTTSVDLPCLPSSGLLPLICLDLTGVDIRFNQDAWAINERIAVSIALLLSGFAVMGTGYAVYWLTKNGELSEVSRSTMHITSMVFVILIGATMFSLVFRGFGGDELVGRFLAAAPGGSVGALILCHDRDVRLGLFPRLYRDYLRDCSPRRAATPRHGHGPCLARHIDGPKPANKFPYPHHFGFRPILLTRGCAARSNNNGSL